MKLYGNDFSPNSNKVRFALGAMNIEYEFQSVNLAAGEQRAESFTKINPVGRIPVLVDGDFTIFESNAIVRYLAEKSGSFLYPKDLESHSLVNQWLDFASIHLGTGAMGKVFFNTIIYKFLNVPRDENSLKEGRQFLANYTQVIETQLSQTPYIAGSEISIADLNILAILDPAEIVNFDLSAYPKVLAWRTALQKKEFYKKVFPNTYTGFVKSVLEQMNSR